MNYTKRTLELKEILKQMRESLKRYSGKIDQNKIEDIKIFLAENSFSGTPIFNCLKIVGGKLEYIFPTIKLEESEEENGYHEAQLKKRGVSLCAFLDTTRPRTDESLTIRLRVTFNRLPKYYTTAINVNEDDFIKMATTSPRNGLKKDKAVIIELLKQAYKAILKTKDFSFDDFEKHFLGKGLNYNNVFDTMHAHILKLKSNNQYGTASTFETALNSFRKYYLFKKGMDFNNVGKQNFYDPEYWKAKNFKFSDITINWLENYTDWAYEKGNGKTTVSINLRALRKLFNDGIKDGELNKAIYPFGNEKQGKYTPPAHHNNKRPLSIECIKAIYESDSIIESSIEAHHIEKMKYYRDMWLFSYLCYGINPKDICRMESKNIDEKYIEFQREKTKGESKTYDIRILLTDDHKRIIQKYGSFDRKYIFGIIDDTMNEETKKDKESYFKRNVSDGMKRLAGLLGFDKKTAEGISWQYSRHSFKTICNEGRILPNISARCMGHIQGLGVSGQYETLTDPQLKEVNEALLPFKYRNQLTEVEKIILDKLDKETKEIFLAMNKEQRQSFTNEYLLKKL